jgi:hypothetical protein
MRDVKMAVLWDVEPSSLVEIHSRFKSAYCLHHQDDNRPDDGGNRRL